jgi:hypothetical protein
MIENGFVYAMEKYSEKQAKIKVRKDKKSDKFYTICRKYNKSLDELTKDELTKTEYNFIVEYITKELKYPMRFYPSLA